MELDAKLSSHPIEVDIPDARNVDQVNYATLLALK